MHFHFHPALRVAEEEYGDAILSRYPMRLIRAGPLPTVDAGFFLESRGALWVQIETLQCPWQILNTHFGLGRWERFLQARALLGEDWTTCASMRPPVVLCGDFNSQTGGRVHRLLAAALRDVQRGSPKNTFPSRFPMLCLDHIFLSEKVRVIGVEVVRTPLTAIASDHLPLLAELALA
jgi:endonuclease/exonuclease/phosphatase family metal-dependent hydrolase